MVSNGSQKKVSLKKQKVLHRGRKIAENEAKLDNDAVFGSFGNHFDIALDVGSELFSSQ